MNVQVEVKAAEVLLGLRNGQKRMVYAAANALNDTAKDVQKAERAQLPASLTLRNQKDFLLRQVAVIKPFASPTQGRLEVRISVGERRGLLLSGYERGFERQPVKGERVAVPITGGARPSRTEPIPESLYIRRLNLRRVTRGGRRRRGRGSVQGAEGTYLVPSVGIFQRLTGRVRRLLYLFVRPFHQAPRLTFLETGRRVVQQRWAPNLLARIAETIQFNLKRS